MILNCRKMGPRCISGYRIFVNLIFLNVRLMLQEQKFRARIQEKVLALKIFFRANSYNQS